MTSKLSSAARKALATQSDGSISATAASAKVMLELYRAGYIGLVEDGRCAVLKGATK